MSTIPTDPSIIHYMPADRSRSSKIIKYMTPEERAIIEAELHIDNPMWLEHPVFDPNNSRANVFKHGKSFHIYNITFRGRVVEDNRPLFPNTIKYMCEWTGFDQSQLRRSYWHRIMPGKRIELHHDNSNGYFRSAKRYHIYLDVPFDFHVVLDGKLWNVYDDCKLTNAVVDFNLFDYHFFVNYTQNPVYLLVFDFYP